VSFGEGSEPIRVDAAYFGLADNERNGDFDE
jgi:hypothetical protein